MPHNNELRLRAFDFAKFFAHLGFYTVAIQTVGFLSMLIKFRYLQAELMGVLGYFVALANMPPAFFENFSRMIGRFVPTAASKRQAEIILVSFLCQSAILAAFAVVTAGLVWGFESMRFWVGHGIDPRLSLYMTAFIVLLVPLNMLSSLLGTCVSAWQKLRAVLVVDLVVASANLVVTIIVSLSVDDRITGLKITAFSTLVSASTVMLMRLLLFTRNVEVAAHLRALRVRQWPDITRSVYRQYLRTYTLPLQLTGVFWYLTENLAVILFARAGLMAEAGIYSLINRIFSVPRKFVPQLLSAIMPRLVISKERDPAVFGPKYVLLSWGQWGVHAVFASALLAALPLIQTLSGLPRGTSVLVLFGAFSFNLLLHAMVTSNSNLILLSSDTRWVLLTSGLRAVVVTALNVTLIPMWQTYGAALAFLVSSTFVLGMYLYENRASGVLGVRVNARQFGASLALAALWVAVAKVLGAW